MESPNPTKYKIEPNTGDECFKGQIARGQTKDEEFFRIVAQVKERKLKRFAQGIDGMQKYQGRICVPTKDNLRSMVVEEAHKGHFTMHPGMKKMYQDLKGMF